MGIKCVGISGEKIKTEITDKDKVNELLALYDAEYDKYTSEEYIASMSTAQFTYEISAGWCVKRCEILDGYGITQYNYLVRASRKYKEYTIFVDYDNVAWENSSYKDKYGAVMPTYDSINREVIYFDEWNRKIADYYKLVGWDSNNDGIVDILPGEYITFTKDMTIKAIYADKPHASTILLY